MLANYFKQSEKEKELIIVDGSETPTKMEGRTDSPNVKYIYQKGLKSVPKKRNIAIEEARGDFITWIDDDDYQIPTKIEILTKRLEAGAKLAGGKNGIWIDIDTGRFRTYRIPNNIPISGTCGIDREVARGVMFDEKIEIASDNNFLRAINERVKVREVELIDEYLMFCLCHDYNISNSRIKGNFPHGDPDKLKELIGDNYEDYRQSVSLLKMNLREY